LSLYSPSLSLLSKVFSLLPQELIKSLNQRKEEKIKAIKRTNRENITNKELILINLPLSSRWTFQNFLFPSKNLIPLSHQKPRKILNGIRFFRSKAWKVSSLQ